MLRSEDIFEVWRFGLYQLSIQDVEPLNYATAIARFRHLLQAVNGHYPRNQFPLLAYGEIAAGAMLYGRFGADNQGFPSRYRRAD